MLLFYVRQQVLLFYVGQKLVLFYVVQVQQLLLFYVGQQVLLLFYVGQQVALLLVRLWQCLNMSPLSQKFLTLSSCGTFPPQYRLLQSVPTTQHVGRKTFVWQIYPIEFCLTLSSTVSPLPTKIMYTFCFCLSTVRRDFTACTVTGNVLKVFLL